MTYSYGVATWYQEIDYIALLNFGRVTHPKCSGQFQMDDHQRAVTHTSCSHGVRLSKFFAASKI